MKSIQVFSIAGIIIILFVIASLACNLPINLLRFYVDKDDPEAEAEFIHTVVADFEPTLVSSEGDLMSLPILHGEDWICKDIHGKISFFEANEKLAPESYIIKKAILDLTMKYNAEDDILLINYLLDMEIDEGYLNVEGDAFEHWNHAKWSDRGKFSTAISIGVNNRSVSGVFDVTTNYQGTYPSTLPHESINKHNFFVLFPPENYNTAYFCDVGANPVPDGWDKLTGENFGDFCQTHFYYECSNTEP